MEMDRKEKIKQPLRRENEIRANYELTVNGIPTFAGVLVEFWNKRPSKNEYSIAETVADSREQYEDEIVDKIMPFLEINCTNMAQYTKEYFERVLAQIKRTYMLKDSTIERYRRNIERTYEAGVAAGKYKSRIIWGEKDAKNKSKTEEKKRVARERKKKSLEPNQEIMAMKWFLSLDAKSISGATLGVVLMLFLGLRNGEACGLCFGDIRDMGNGHHCAYILRSTEAGTSKIQIGGKTKNAFRTIPIYGFLYDFLMERKQYVIAQLFGIDNEIANTDSEKESKQDPVASNTQVTSDESVLSPEEIELRMQTIPIASKHDLKSNLSASDLTAEGNRILEEHIFSNVDKAVLDALSYDYLAKLKDAGIDEKDPTVYLFRRNYATHACNLGLNANEVEFLIGHNIEEPGIYRHFFSSGEELEKICRIMDNHPFCVLYEEMQKQSKVDGISKHNDETTLQITVGPQKRKVRIVASEPMDDIAVTFSKDSTAEIEGYYSYASLPPNGYPRTVNINGMVTKNYRRKYKKYEHRRDGV